MSSVNIRSLLSDPNEFKALWASTARRSGLFRSVHQQWPEIEVKDSFKITYQWATAVLWNLFLKLSKIWNRIWGGSLLRIVSAAVIWWAKYTILCKHLSRDMFFICSAHFRQEKDWGINESADKCFWKPLQTRVPLVQQSGVRDSKIQSYLIVKRKPLTLHWKMKTSCS